MTEEDEEEEEEEGEGVNPIRDILDGVSLIEDTLG